MSAVSPGVDTSIDATGVHRRLLEWYDANARDLPWRVGPAERRRGVRPDPYRVWLSEVMLQQTTTAHAAPYFRAFTARWPTVEALAAADEGAVMAAWAGLGYYARARNLIACARKVAGELGGVFPSEEKDLRTLPGVGAYIGAAVAAIAFDRAANVVDANVERVTARLFAVAAELPAARGELARLAGTLVAKDRPGDWAQALMDLGATVCTPKSPRCLICPLSGDCAAYAAGAPETYPRKAAKRARPERHGVAYVQTRGGAVALVRRPAKGLLGGMLALPASEWGASAPVPAPGWRDAGTVTHVFTHFALTLRVMTGGEAVGEVLWTPVEEARAALPTVFKKALDRGLG